MTKAVGYISLKPEAIGEFCAHGDVQVYQVFTEVDTFIFKYGDQQFLTWDSPLKTMSSLISSKTQNNI